MKASIFVSNLALILTILQACHNRPGNSGSMGTSYKFNQLADEMEESLFKYIIGPWYPENIDSTFGGYISAFSHDWTVSEGSQDKAIVQQARHVWATSRIYEAYPDKKEFLEYAHYGFDFLLEAMWDSTYGGFHAYVSRDGAPRENSIDDKRIYGQAFGLYGLSQYYSMSQHEEALALAKKAFLWMEEHAHDHQYGGYFEMLRRDGTPTHLADTTDSGEGYSSFSGIKDYNSSIHIMEAITQLYLIWPDSLVRKRLEEMFILIRDTFVHPDGYLQLFFRPDWTLVTEEAFNPHITYGHDVETAYLLLETADVLGWGEDEKTHQIAKQLVDHSLASGWDQKAGGFFDAGKEIDGRIKIINNHKSWWSQVEGMNALLLMHTLYPDDPNDYYGKFLKAWEHIDNYLIDKKFGGWYNNALDTSPESVTQDKSHVWKTTYHNARGMINCIHMLRFSLTESEPF